MLKTSICQKLMYCIHQKQVLDFKQNQVIVNGKNLNTKNEDGGCYAVGGGLENRWLMVSVPETSKK